MEGKDTLPEAPVLVAAILSRCGPLFRGRRQADEIKVQPAEQTELVDWRRRCAAGRFEFGEDKRIDGRANPRRLLDRRNYRTCRGLKRPVLPVGWENWLFGNRIGMGTRAR